MASSSAFVVNLDTPRHKLVTGCMLNALPCCCSCADIRPQATAYPVYVDGKGIRMDGNRWQRYCRRCHDYWQSLASNSGPSDPITQTPRSTSTASLTSDMPPARRSRDGYTSQPVHYTNETQLLTPPDDSSTFRNRYDQNQPGITDSQQPSTSRNQREPIYPLGTREDVQQDDYESPLAGMFGRAYGRYREAEEARQAAQIGRTQPISSIGQDGTHHDITSRFFLPRRNPLFDPAAVRTGRQAQEDQARVQGEINRLYEARYVDRRNRLTDYEGLTENRTELSTNNTQDRSNPEAAGFVPGSPPMLPVMHSSPRRTRFGFHRQFYTNPFETSLRMPHDNALDDDDISVNPIDSQTSRPSPFKSEDLKVDLGCKVCTEQKINTICMPCMHACMCRWCASIHKDDCRDLETGRWNNSLWKCPICRKQISEVKRIYI